MAAGNSITVEFEKQELDDTLNCCICTNVYTDPKVLPCIHTFCRKCLQETALSTNKGPGDEMPCPICRRQFKIPREGFHVLPNNFFIAKLIQVATISNPSSSSKSLCDSCVEENEEEGKETPTSDMYCIQCKQKLCEECCRHHRKLKLTKNHKLMPINDYQESDENVMENLAPSVCELHEQKVLDIYCVDCKTVECAVCFIEGHKQHEGSHVNKFVEGFRKQIENNVETINHCSSQTQMKKEELIKIKEDVLQKVKSLEMDAVNRRDELKQFVDTQANYLLQSLYSRRQSKLKEIEMETGDIDAHLSCLKSYSSFCQKIMAKGSVSDMFRAVSDLTVRSIELQQHCQSLMEREIRPFKFCFRKSEFEEFWKGDNLIGAIEGELRYKLDSVLVQTIRKKAVEKEEKKGIVGLTILDKELFVVSKVSSEVEVYDSMNFSLRRQWNLKELIRPLDIGSCNRNKCLYIYDCKGLYGQSNEILKVDPDGKIIKSWSTGDDCGFGLSVTDDSTVILSIFYENKLNEYSSDGQLIREINLSVAGILNPLHAIKLNNGNFVVSHSYGDLHRVCLVDGDGKLKKSFGGKRGSTIGQMNFPEYLAFDGNGFVMVADRLNRRVLSLDSNLEFNKEILSKEKHGLQDPQRVLLDETNNRLFVADNELDSEKTIHKDGHILIFEFR